MFEESLYRCSQLLLSSPSFFARCYGKEFAAEEVEESQQRCKCYPSRDLYDRSKSFFYVSRRLIITTAFCLPRKCRCDQSCRWEKILFPQNVTFGTAWFLHARLCTDLYIFSGAGLERSSRRSRSSFPRMSNARGEDRADGVSISLLARDPTLGE